MVSFTIDGAEFGIDRNRSRCALARRWLRGPAVTIEVHGDPAAFDRLNQREDSPWSWALYPPSFTLRGLPVPKPKGGQPIEVRPTPEEVERHDGDLYMMEHNPVRNVVLRLGPGSEMRISGEVELFGEPRAFRIEWTG